MAGAAALCLPGAVPALAQSKPPVVVELFTSQGCSSCPPADQMFNTLADDSNLVTLSYHVNYWDYLGWKDTLAKEDFSQRQYDYAHNRGDMDVYTPQVIVQGVSHHVGSNLTEIQSAVKSATASTGPWVTPVLTTQGQNVEVFIPALGGAPGCTVWLASVVPSKTIKVERGENAGKEITYRNVVRALLPAGMWSGEAVSLKMPASSVLPHDCRRCVALVQVGKGGPIIGAAAVTVTA